MDSSKRADERESQEESEAETQYYFMESPGQKTLAQKTFWITLWIKIISSVPNMFLSSSQWVPNKFLEFPMGSQQVPWVPNVFPKGVPISTSL